MQKFFIRLLFLGAFFSAEAQLPLPCLPGQAPADDCSDACIYCNFNGLVSSTTGYTSGPANGFCGSIENDQWLGFIAGASSATFTATPLNCTNGDGVQMAIYDDCNGVPIDCNGGQGGGGSIPVILTDVPLVPGTNYFLLVDGFGGDQCTFSIIVDPPIAVIAPPLGSSIGPIQGPGAVCPGAVVTYSVPPVPNAGAYTWTVPSGWLINGLPSPQQVLAGDGGNSVQITIGSSSGQICVKATNSCYSNGPSICKVIMVAPIPPTILQPVAVCNEDTPYTLPWGDQAPSSGIYQTILESYLGCDSIVRLQVTIKPPLVTNLPPKTICAGDHVTICGVDYIEAGSFAHLCESYQGCDSVVNFSVEILDPVAHINGGGTLTCNTTAITLTASPSPQGTIFNWKNPLGQILSVSNSLNVTTPGFYILTATLNGGGIQCTKGDTILIGSNTIPPSVSSTGGILNCTVNAVQLMAMSNATAPAWAWSGPGGFTASIANPIAVLTGTYLVTVTNSVSGCSATSTAIVTANTALPEITTFGATLSCAINFAQITVIPDPTTVTFNWNGPNNFTSNIQTPTVTEAGNYNVTVTNTVNNCTATGTAPVLLNNTPPGASALAVGAIGCTTPTVQLNGGPGTPGNTFVWSGPNGFFSTAQNPNAGTAGIYSVVVRGANGCTSVASAPVFGDTLAPNAVATGGTVTCGVQSISIFGNSDTNDVTFGWSGPAGFASGLQNPMVSDTGAYILTVTGPNTCTNTSTTVVLGDFATPNASATGGTITCTQSTTFIAGTSNTTGATLAWTGPGGFTSNLATVEVNTVGNYVVIATGPNGCTTTATAFVLPDANLPNATAEGGVLNCTTDTVALNGGSTSQGVLLTWSGPNNYYGIDEDPMVTVAGVYVLTVINTSNGCTAQASATVGLDTIPPGALVEGDTLTCAEPSALLNGLSIAPNAIVSWFWTGPDNFSSNDQNPAVNEQGDYFLKVVNVENGCVSTTTATVEVDQVYPVASSSSGILTCILDTLVLQAASNMSCSFEWTGPEGFSFNGDDPNVVAPGNYQLVATSLGNGCRDTLEILVGQNISTPDSIVTTGNTINCLNSTVTIGAYSPAAIAYLWSGPGIINPSIQQPMVNTSGLYVVTLTGANGCTSMAETAVELDVNPPNIVALSNNIVTCLNPMVNIQTIINTTSPLMGVVWSGPNNFMDTTANTLVSSGGNYTIVATAVNGCTNEALVAVQEDTANPDISGIGGTISCVDTLITIYGNSQTNAASFNWTGPDNFNSTEKDPVVGIGGVYTLTAISPNGCTASTPVVVLLDIAKPDIVTNVSNVLDCNDLTATVSGSSLTQTVEYRWIGPNNFNANTASALVNTPGDYELFVKASNGCISNKVVSVVQDTTPPDASAVGGTVNCITGQLALNGISSAPGASYNWIGPNQFTATTQNPTVSFPGEYQLTVTGTNGCTATATADVVANNESPMVTLGGGGTLTCTTLDLLLTSSIQTPGATGLWSGPNITNPTNSDITVSTPGTYMYTVIAPNGCISTPVVSVLQNILPPQSVSATGGLLNCTFPTVQLNASSTSQVSYFWNGPGNFTSSLRNPFVTNPGSYTVTFTDVNNQCTATAVAVVTQDPTVPDVVVTADSLTCTTTSVVLNATSNTPNVTYLWSGPNNFTATQEDPTASVPGLYTVVARASSGCTTTYNYVLAQNTTHPMLSVLGYTLTCAQPSGIISAYSTTIGSIFQWTGPNNFTSVVATPMVTEAGLYSVVATSPNGCSTSAQVNVVSDITIPVIGVLGGTITCAIPTITLSATSDVVVEWNWLGPDNFVDNSQNPTISVPGNYMVTATALNGCVRTGMATVLSETQSPNTTISTPDQLDCTTTQVGLNATTAGVGQYSYQWQTQGGAIQSGANTNSPLVTRAGVYTVLVTNLSTGCTTTKEVVVGVDPATPSGIVAVQKNVSCHGETDGKLRIDSIVGGTAPFVYSVDKRPFESAVLYTALTPGTHSLEVQDANGCSYETSFFIDEPEDFLINIGSDTTIHLGQSIVINLQNFSTTPERVKETRVTPVTLIFPDTLTPLQSFRYQVEAIDSNGCVAKDDRTIRVDRERWIYIPNIFKPNTLNNNLLQVFGGDDTELIVSFLVFDRWGTEVFQYNNFQPNDPAAGWDGTYNGQDMNPGVFVYLVQVQFKDGETEIFKGDVTLIR
jgi:gliding motility-associated-like protein